jgi:ParB family transcriptional regulator, chromosome partitioning protein
MPGLGRGLSALIPQSRGMMQSSANGSTSDGSSVLRVPPEQIVPNPRQPRRVFDDEQLEGLARSIAAHGILQPLVVTHRVDGGYELLAGERRLRASKLAGLATVPVIVHQSARDDSAKLEIALIENIQREELNAIDCAVAYRELHDYFGLTQEAISERVGISRSAVAHALRLLALPESIQDAIRSGLISEGHGKVLCGIKDEAEQLAWFERIMKEKLPIAGMVARLKQSPSSSGRTSTTRDPNVVARELSLQRQLSARVTIVPRGQGGTISISYSDDEELQGIINTITK